MLINFEILKDYIPERSIPILKKWFNQHPFKLKITKKRTTKFGDFRVETKNKTPQISVNSNLNQFAFLITLTHEFAHLLVWKEHQHKVKAHGSEWKSEFKLLMSVLLQKNIFPDDISLVLKKHMINPPASSARDIDLVKALKKHDAASNTLHLLDIPEGSIFTINNKKTFIKGKKQRTRFLCKETTSKKQYLIHGIADVKILD